MTLENRHQYILSAFRMRFRPIKKKSLLIESIHPLYTAAVDIHNVSIVPTAAVISGFKCPCCGWFPCLLLLHYSTLAIIPAFAGISPTVLAVLLLLSFLLLLAFADVNNHAICCRHCCCLLPCCCLHPCGCWHPCCCWRTFSS